MMFDPKGSIRDPRPIRTLFINKQHSRGILFVPRFSYIQVLTYLMQIKLDSNSRTTNVGNKSSSTARLRFKRKQVSYLNLSSEFALGYFYFSRNRFFSPHEWIQIVTHYNVFFSFPIDRSSNRFSIIHSTIAQKIMKSNWFRKTACNCTFPLHMSHPHLENSSSHETRRSRAAMIDAHRTDKIVSNYYCKIND